MSDEEDSMSEGFSASEDEWKPSKYIKDGESSDDDDSEFEEAPLAVSASGGSGTGAGRKCGRSKGQSATKQTSPKKRAGLSLRTKLYNKYRPPPKTFSPPSNVVDKNTPLASTSRTNSKNAVTPNESKSIRCKNKDGEDSGSSSDSSINNYLVNPDDLDIQSSFFNVGAKTSVSPAPVFDCNVGLANPTDSESDDEEEDTKKDDKTFDFKNLLDYAESLERVKESIAKHNAEESSKRTKAKSKVDTLDVYAVLALGEKQQNRSHNDGEDEDDEDDHDVKNEKKLSQNQPSKLGKTKSTRIKRHTKTRPTSTVADDDTDDSDWEEVADNSETVNTTALHSGNIEIRVEMSSSLKKKTRTQLDLEMALKRKLNREIKERQVLLHKASLLCQFGRAFFYNRLLNDTSLMQKVLKFLPSKSSYPTEKGTEIKYFQSMVTWFRSVIKLKSQNLYPDKTAAKTKSDAYNELLKQIENKEARSKQDLVFIFIILLRGMGLQCRLIINMQPLPLKPSQSDMITIKMKKENENDHGSSKVPSKSIKVEDREIDNKADTKHLTPLPKEQEIKQDSIIKVSDVKEIKEEKQGATKESLMKPIDNTVAISELDTKDNILIKDHVPEDKSKVAIGEKIKSKITKRTKQPSKAEINKSSVSENLKSCSKEQKDIDTVNDKTESSAKTRRQLKKPAKENNEPEHDDVACTTKQNKKAKHEQNHISEECKKDVSQLFPKTTKKNQNNEVGLEKSQVIVNAESSIMSINETSTVNGHLPQQDIKNELKLSQKENTTKSPIKSSLARLKRTKATDNSDANERKSNKRPIIDPGSPVIPKVIVNAGKDNNAKEQPSTSRQLRNTRSRSKSPQAHISTAFLLQNSQYKEKFPGIIQQNANVKNKPTRAKSPIDKVKISPDFMKNTQLANTQKRVLRSRQKTNETTSDNDAKSTHLQIPQLDGGNDVDVDKQARNKKLKSKKDKKKSSNIKNLKSQKSKHDSDEDFEPTPPKKPKTAPHLSKRDRRVLSSEDEDDNLKSPEKAQRKQTAGDMWLEVWCDVEEQWVCVDIFKGKVHCIDTIRKSASPNLAYVFAFQNDLSLKDVTARYCSNWTTIVRKSRVDKAWLDTAICKYLGHRTKRDIKEDQELRRIHEEKPMPTAISDYKNHPFYALERHLLKFEAIYPPDAPALGYVRGEQVYSRDCVHTLHSREIWLKQARTVKLGEKPYKIVKARPKWDRITQTVIKDQPLEIFGYWQTQDYEPPTAENGLVPRNAYGNVELFKPSMLPKKTAHIRLPGLNRICKKLGVDCANAVIGFDFHQGACHPTYDGFVVCEEFADQVIAAWHQDQENQELKEQEKYEARVYGNWKKLIRGLLIRERLKLKYNF